MKRSNQKNSTHPILRTIKCHLRISEDVLRKVWEEMSQKNTPLIVELLKVVSEQPDFETKKETGEISKKEITELRKSLTKDSDLEKQSSRLRSSADSFLQEVYSSWLTLYKKRIRQKEGKEYFLNNILKSDVEIMAESNSDLQTIRNKAQEILAKPEEILKQVVPQSSKKNKPAKELNVTEILYEIHKKTDNILTRCAVAYLLKNHNKVSDNIQEDIKKLKERRNQKKVEIRRLEKQLQENRLPHGRDITGITYLEAFDNLINQVPR